MMDIKTYLYNTLTKSVDEFVPNEEGKVAMYTCGPTVYHLHTLEIFAVTLWKMYLKNTCVMLATM